MNRPESGTTAQLPCTSERSAGVHAARSDKSSVLRRAASLAERGAPAVFILLILVGVLVRVLTLRTTWGAPDSDVATGMIMADRAAHGHLTTVFWGGDYGGTLLTWFEAVFIRIFGFHFWIFYFWDALATLGCSLVLKAITDRFLGRLASAVVAGSFWFFPPNWLYWTDREYVFWLPAIFFALVFEWLVIRSDAKPSWWVAGLAGIAAGLSVWSYPLAAPLLIPGLVALAWCNRRRVTALVATLVGIVVGVSPWLIWLETHRHRQNPDPQSWSTAVHHALGMVLPDALLSVTAWVPPHWVSESFSGVVYAGSALAMVVFAVKRRWALASAGAAVVLWFPIVVLARVYIDASTYRYGLIVVAPVLVLVGWLFERARASLVLAVAVVVVTLTTIGHTTNTFTAVPACQPDMRQVISNLESQGRTDVFGAYWVAYDLSVCSSMRITASPTGTIRDVAAAKTVAAAPQSTYVVFANQTLSQQISKWVSANHASATRTVIGGLEVWAFAGQVQPQTMQLNGLV